MRNLGRLRVPGGQRFARIWRPSVLALLLTCTMSGEETARTYAYVEMNGFHTRLSITNPTPDPIDVLRPCPDGQSICPPITDRIQPYRTVSTYGWPRAGTDIESLTLDSRLLVFTEITTIYGTIFRKGALVPHTTTAWVFDLPEPVEFQNLFWLAVAPGQEGTFLTIIDEGDTSGPHSYEMRRGAITALVRGPVVRVVPGAAPGWPALPAPAEFYLMPITVHTATGAATAQIE